jgi:XrtN system VIT domain protein
MQEKDLNPMGITPQIHEEDTPSRLTRDVPSVISTFKNAAPAAPPIFKPWQDTRYICGLTMLALSFVAFYFFSDNTSTLFGRGNNLGGGFWFCHIFMIVFWGVMTFSKKAETQWFATKIDYTLLLMVLMQIGAFALNGMELEVFPPSVLWLQVALTVHCGVLLAFSFRDVLPRKVMYGLFFLMGIGFALDLYFLCFTLPLAMMGMAAIWFFGLSAYATAPFFKVIYQIVFLVKTNAFDAAFKRYFFGGFAVSIVATVLFTSSWYSLANKAERALGDENNPLPSWVRIAQVLPPSVLSEKLLKSEVPTVSNDMFLSFSRVEERLHDPFMVVANALKPMPRMDDDDRRKALRAIFDARTQAEERLWSGNNLRIEKVKTAIELYPAHRLAYTEKTINVKSVALSQNRFDTEEAIFTFRLPEGGVVTSSSLWIDGEERTAFLTTRGKADSAYRAVVGVERRDPSVVHWQEGNTVTVRVFPCSPTLPRQFKLGFTTPLRKISDKLVYENIPFDGVIANGVIDSLSLSFAENTSVLSSNELKFDKNDKKITAKTDAMDAWSIALPCPNLSNDVFSFDKKNYRATETTPQYEAFDAQEIYLDINSTWSKTECKHIAEWAAAKQVFAFSKHELVRLTAENSTTIFEELLNQNFSVFPIHLIKNPVNALVVTKNKPFSPNFTDLKGSRFANDMAAILPYATSVRVFGLDNRFSTYYNTLRQMRVIVADGGSLDDLKKTVFLDKKFLKNTETTTLLNIPASQMSIEETPVLPNTINQNQNTNEHLLRLFVYNKILASVGKNYFRKDYDMKPLVDLAEKAYVVSPVSSLIVLETEADYERFGIKKGQKKSLGNAVLSQAAGAKSGAAPEPQEWLLILLALGVVTFFARKQFFE